VSSLATKDIFYIIRDSATQSFVETGTYKGDTVEWARHRFSRVYSVELGQELHAKNLIRFAGAGNVELYNMDSVEGLRAVLPRITDKCFFWLDAHYSLRDTALGEISVPLIEELEAIKTHSIRNHVIIIDDVRLFGWDDPRGLERWGGITIPKLTALLKSINPGYRVVQYNDTLIAALPTDLRPFPVLRQYYRKVVNKLKKLFSDPRR